MLKRFVMLTIAILSAAATMSPSATLATENDADAVRKAADNFYGALNSMFTGELSPMIDVWSHDSDVTYMGPGGGRRVGWDEVLAVWEQQAALKLGGEVKAERMQITIGRDLAVVNCFEIGQNLGPDGKIEKVAIRATNVFRNENGQWKMIGHHTDLLPFLQK